MFHRILAVVPMLALALLICAPAVVVAEDQAATHEGKLVRIDGNKFTMTDKDGKNEHTHTLAADARITLDGKDARMGDLKPGMNVKVTTKKDNKDMAFKIEAKSGQ